MCIQNEILSLILLVKENLFTTINIKGTFLMTWHVRVMFCEKRLHHDCHFWFIIQFKSIRKVWIFILLLFLLLFLLLLEWWWCAPIKYCTFFPSFRSTSTLFVFLAQVGHIVDKLRGSCIGGLFRFLHRCINSRHRIWTSFQKIF